MKQRLGLGFWPHSKPLLPSLFGGENRARRNPILPCQSPSVLFCYLLFNCIDTAQQPAQLARTRVRVPPVELDGSRPTAPRLSRREVGRGKQVGN